MNGKEVLQRLADEFVRRYPRVRELSDYNLPSKVAEHSRPYVNLWKFAASVQLQVLFNAPASLEPGIAFDDRDPAINDESASAYYESLGAVCSELGLELRQGRGRSNYHLTREVPVSRGKEDDAIESALSLATKLLSAQTIGSDSDRALRRTLLQGNA